jgi:hypothetical protein
MAVVDDIGPLSNPFRFDALAQALEKEIREVGAVTRRDTFHEKVEMQCAAPLELHMHEPFDRPALPRCTPQLPQMITTPAPVRCSRAVNTSQSVGAHLRASSVSISTVSTT